MSDTEKRIQDVIAYIEELVFDVTDEHVFRDGYTGGFTPYAGAVAEKLHELVALATTGGETEWEYGCISSSHTPLNAEARRFDWIDDARSHEFECASPAIVRRRKAGPWVAVDPTSPETTEEQS